MSITEKELARRIKERRIRKELYELHRKDILLTLIPAIILFVLSLVSIIVKTDTNMNVPIFLMGMANGGLVAISVSYLVSLCEQIEKDVNKIMESDNSNE